MADEDSDELGNIIPPVNYKGKFSLLRTFSAHEERLRARELRADSKPRESWAITVTNAVVSEVLLDLVSKLRGDPALRPEDLSLDQLSDALEDAFEVEIEYLEEEICELLGRAFSSREFRNLQKLLIREERHCWRVLDGMASGKLPNLEHLSLLDLPLQTRELELIVKALDTGRLSNLRYLELRDNGIGDETLHALGRAAKMGRFRNLQVLRLEQEGSWESAGEDDIEDHAWSDRTGTIASSRSNRFNPKSPRPKLASVIRDDGVKSLAEGLCSDNFANLHSLELCISSDFLGATGVSALARVLESRSAAAAAVLKTLRLANHMTSIPQEGSAAVARALTTQHVATHLEELFLGGFHGGEVVAIALGSPHFPVLNNLSLCELELGVQAAAALAKAMTQGKLPNLRVLDLQNNDLGEEGVKALVAAFKTGSVSKLEEVHLSLQGPGDDDAVAIAGLLSGGLLPNLRALELGSVAGEKGAAALLKAYRDTPSLLVRLETSWPSGKPWPRLWRETWSRNWTEECKRQGYEVDICGAGGNPTEDDTYELLDFVPL